MKLKRISAAVLLSSLVMTATSYAADFADTKGHWAEAVIDLLAAKGVVHGVSETEFNPDGIVTRAEFYKMILGAAGISDTTYRYGECLDVEYSDWFAPCIQSTLDKGLIPEDMIEDFSVEVISDDESSRAVYKGSFKGDIPVTREEMAYITQSVYQYSMEEADVDKLELPLDLPFYDVSAISVWAIDGVKHAYSNDLISGMDDGTFRPRDTATRAQAAAIINNIMMKWER